MTRPGPLVCPSCQTWVVASGGLCARCRRLLEGPSADDVVIEPARGAERGSVGAGFALLLLLHLLQVPMNALVNGAWIVLGVTQLLYGVPALVVAASRGQTDTAKGIALGALLTFLLNAACFGIVCGRLS